MNPQDGFEPPTSPPRWIRTTNLWNYSPALYPIELSGIYIFNFLFAFFIYIYSLTKEGTLPLQLLDNVDMCLLCFWAGYVDRSFLTIPFLGKYCLLLDIRKVLSLSKECLVPLISFFYISSFVSQYTFIVYFKCCVEFFDNNVYHIFVKAVFVWQR